VWHWIFLTIATLAAIVTLQYVCGTFQAFYAERSTGVSNSFADWFISRMAWIAALGFVVSCAAVTFIGTRLRRLYVYEAPYYSEWKNAFCGYAFALFVFVVGDGLLTHTLGGLTPSSDGQGFKQGMSEQEVMRAFPDQSLTPRSYPPNSQIETYGVFVGTGDESIAADLSSKKTAMFVFSQGRLVSESVCTFTDGSNMPTVERVF